MTLQNFLYELERGTLYIEMKGVDREKALLLGGFLEEHDFKAWDKTQMDEYIVSRFIEDTYLYMVCRSKGRYDVSATTILSYPRRSGVELDDVLRMIEEDTCVAENESIISDFEDVFA